MGGWELYVRRVYDTLNVAIFITGSSAKLLSSEIATSLRGRTISFEIFPFSFGEYLKAREIQINLNSSKALSFIKNALESYLTDGGFAETIGEDKSKLYENVVFLHLRRQTKEIYYFKQNHEVDFYAKLDDRTVLINVSYEIKDEKTRAGEINGLLEAMEYFGMPEATIVTKDENGLVEPAARKKIHILPLYKYLLSNE